MHTEERARSRISTETERLSSDCRYSAGNLRQRSPRTRLPRGLCISLSYRRQLVRSTTRLAVVGHSKRTCLTTLCSSRMACCISRKQVRYFSRFATPGWELNSHAQTCRLYGSSKSLRLAALRCARRWPKAISWVTNLHTLLTMGRSSIHDPHLGGRSRLVACHGLS